MYPARDFKADRLQRKRRGFYLAEVTANSDGGSDSRYRVKVKYPWLAHEGGDETSYWARILTPMAGNERGAYFLPEVGDQVLVVFEHGDINRPIIVGGVWSDAQKPPEKNSNGDNNIRVIKSRSGHRLIFDDTSGSEKVTLVHSNKKSAVCLDTGGKSVTLQCGGDITIKASSGAGRFHGQAVKITAKGSFEAEGATVTADATAKIAAKANSSLTIKGGMIQINAGGGAAVSKPGSSATASGSEGSRAGEQVTESGGGGGGGGDGGGGGTDEGGPSEGTPDESAPGEAAEGGGGGGAPGQAASSPQGSPMQRAQTARATVAEVRGTATQVTGKAKFLAHEMEVGRPFEVSALADNVPSAHYELVNPATGEVLGSGSARVMSGNLTADVDTRVLGAHPDVAEAQVRLVGANGNVLTQTDPVPVAGRSAPLGGPSPSTALLDPAGPAPQVGAAQPSLAPGGAPLTEADLAAEAGPAGAAAQGDVGGAVGGGAAGAAASGDAGGAVSQAAGGQAGAAASGDVGGAVGGGAAGAAASGDAGGAVSQAAGGKAGAAASGDVGGAVGGGAAGAAAEGDVGGAAGVGASSGGVDPDVVEAAEAAAHGDAGGAASAVGGSQAGAAVEGDAGGAVGGGAAGAAASGDVGGAVSAESSTAGAAASVGADPSAAGGAVTGDAAAKAAGVRALDADSPEDMVDDAGRDVEQQAKDESGVGAAEDQVASAKSEANTAKMKGERAADVEARADAASSDAEYSATADARADVSSAQDQARGTQRDAAASAMDPQKQVVEERATLSDAEQGAGDAAASPEREAAAQQSRLENQTSDARDPEAAARRSRDDAMDQAKQESIVDSRATIEESDVGQQASGERAEVVDHRDRGEETAHDPDKAVKRKLRDDLDD